jgi:drug/metabolite transporter (DMT)-like permease
MPIPENILGIIFALTSAVVWGGGDFTGGFATRRGSQYYVLAVSALSGLVILIIAAVVLRESFPSVPGIIWSMLAGGAGAVGIAALYRALSIGHAASIAPTTAVISAALPVMFGVITVGFPSPIQLSGFGLALAGIWLISGASSAEGRATREEFLLACIAGVGFGAFFIFLGQVDRGKIFTPLIISRCLTFLTGLALLKMNRQPFPSLFSNPYALLAGVLDVGGNLFFILAKQYTRLDIAAVLASFYPASTVFLATILLKEKITPRRWLGVMVCLAAIALITI